MAVLSRIQTGQATITVGSSTITPTVSTYDASKSVLTFSVRGGNGNPGDSSVVGVKASSTTLRFQKDSAVTTTLVIEWQLQEYSSGVSVQDLSYTVNGTQAISTVDTAKAYIVSCGWRNTGTVTGSDDNARLRIVSSTQTAQDMDPAGGQNFTEAFYQVVEYDNASVQQITLSAITTDTTINQSVSAVTLAQTAIFGTSYMVADFNFDDIFRAQLTSTTNLQLNRTAVALATMPICFFVVDYVSGEWSVQRGSTSVANGTSTQNQSITSVDSAVSYARATPAFGGGFAVGQSNAATDDYGVNRCTAILSTNSNLQFQRSANTSALTMDWEVATYVGIPSPVNVVYLESDDFMLSFNH